MTAVEANVLAPMVGAVITSIHGAVGDEQLTVLAADGRQFRFWYEHDCCASCNITDIIGDLADLLESPLLVAEEVSSADAERPAGEYIESYTWTFYRFATARGTVTVRWLGESNGYYSERVSFEVVS